MKKQLKSILTQIRKGLEPLCKKSENIDEYTIYTSILIATASLKYIKIKNMISNTINESHSKIEEDVFQLLEKRFPELMKIYHKIDSYFVDKYLKEELQQQINILFYDIDENIDNLISWMYQYLKKDLEKLAFKKKKKEHTDLLYTTQFFTDDYMVRYLVDKSFEQINTQEIERVYIIDCASGGGNFLTYSFEKLYYLIKKIYPSWSNRIIVDYILNNSILGYDLDSNLSNIASLSLFVKACNYAIPSETTCINIFGGEYNDKLGYLNNNIHSNTINNTTFNSKIKQSKQLNKIRIFLTNPPFMGKRDMDIELKDYILKKYPDCKGDLCVSFIKKLNDEMHDNDVLGVVSQNNWMFLSSLSNFREFFLEEKKLVECVDLGTNAFDDINGEKTNIGLFIIKNIQNDELTRFIDLKDLNKVEKRKSLNRNKFPKELVFEINQKQFLENENYEFNYRLKTSFNNILKLPIYSEYGKPMQGSSTGNNKKFIKYIWEINGKKDWSSVSKGGGFSKWVGLNYFMVYWGENASKVKENKGSALRNIDKIPSTDLVYSDTGTLGLNVRMLKPNQVFIASGPGIIVNYGNKFAHLAFLNSRVATFLLKLINPKFSISAGYISKINVANNILDSDYIVNKSKECVNIKDMILSRKLPNKEFVHLDYNKIFDIEETISNTIIKDLRLEYELLKLESQIEKRIMEQYNFTLNQEEEMRSIVGKSPFKYNISIDKTTSAFSVERFDKLLSSSININCIATAKSVDKYTNGTTYLLEQISFKIEIHPKVILEYIETNIMLFKNLRKIYLFDFIHKVILNEVNINNLSSFVFKEYSIENLLSTILNKYPYFNKIRNLDTYVEIILKTHHKNSFLNKPIFCIKDKKLVEVGNLFE